jgi:formylglycine-generating enzyme required for sulfatase activity
MTPLQSPPHHSLRAFCYAIRLGIAGISFGLGFALTITASASPDPSTVISPTALRYQGRLSDASGPAHGNYDLRFALFASLMTGQPVAGPLTNLAVTVSNGLFTTTIDFGANVFGESARWLEVGVRPAGSSEDFVTLTPRQALTPVPYSLHTLRAESLVGTLPISQLPTNVARLDADLAFSGQVRFATNVSVTGVISATKYSGDGGGLSNVSATATALSARLAQRLWRVPIPFVLITNAGNAPDPATGKGSIPYNFRMGKYEVNNNQYCAFLNAVAADDPNGLYDTNMTFDVHGGILRHGNPGEYDYSVKPGMGHQPVVWVEFPEALRFCNWLHNGQPSGPQDETTTEDGAYTMNPETVWGNTIRRNPGARFWIPSDDEWYKAAYHQPAENGGDSTSYWTYPTRSNEVPFPEEPPGFDSNSANACCTTGRMATDVGAYVNSGSFYGTFDQAGNVEEWTEEIVYVTNRRLRGGSWSYNETYSKKTDFEFDTPDYEADGIGFRVAGSAE